MKPTENSGHEAASPALEKHYTCKEIGEAWGLTTKTIQRIFFDEPGVLRIGSDRRRGKRSHFTLRIPASVAERVHARMSVRDHWPNRKG